MKYHSLSNSKRLKAAIAYAKSGWPVLAVHGVKSDGRCTCGKSDCEHPGKHPCWHKRWLPHGVKNATTDPELIRRWWRMWPWANVAIATGKVSGVDVLDVDVAPDVDGNDTLTELTARHGELPDTVEQITGGGGRQLFFRYSGRIKGRARFAEGLDTRSDGNYVIVPPSRHASGRRYEWELSSQPGEAAPVEMPEWLIQVINGNNGNRAHVDGGRVDPKRILRGVPEGERDVAIYRYACSLRARNIDYNEAVYLVCVAAGNCEPPFPEKEAVAKVKSAWRHEPGKNPATDAQEKRKQSRKSQADQLVKIGSSAVLFHTADGESFAAIAIGNHREVHQIRSRHFKQWLSRQFYKQTEKAPNSDALNQSLNVLSAIALFDGPQITLRVRAAKFDGAFYYDLGDAEWHAIKVTQKDWEIVSSPLLFKRYVNTAAQVRPDRGKPSDLLNFFKLFGLSGESRLLLTTYVVTAFIPEIPKPILGLHGEKGGGKSTLLRIVRSIIDPAIQELLTLRADERETALLLSQNYAAFFDNVSGFSGTISDLLCRAVTGAGFLSRALYTDNELKIYRLRTLIGFNGIHLPSSAADLQDRMVTIELERIPPASRKPEVEILKEFEAARPRLLGAIFNALAAAMSLEPVIRRQLGELPRLADWAVWAAAVAEAMGIGAESFLMAYTRNIGRINETFLAGHAVGTAIRVFMAKRKCWRGRPAELLALLEEIAETEKINVKARGWPKAAHVLTRRLKEIKSNLADVGIIYEPGQPPRRILTLKNHQKST